MSCTDVVLGSIWSTCSFQQYNDWHWVNYGGH